jgi:hypothetical protein
MQNHLTPKQAGKAISDTVAIVKARATSAKAAVETAGPVSSLAVARGYLALAADVWISPCNFIPLYVERSPGNFDRWCGPTGRYAGEYGYPIYRKMEPDNT